MTSSQGQVLKQFQTISLESEGEEGANGWHHPVTRSQMGDPEAPPPPTVWMLKAKMFSVLCLVFTSRYFVDYISININTESTRFILKKIIKTKTVLCFPLNTINVCVISGIWCVGGSDPQVDALEAAFIQRWEITVFRHVRLFGQIQGLDCWLVRLLKRETRKWLVTNKL